MGRQPLRRWRRIDRAELDRAATALFARLGVPIDPDLEAAQAAMAATAVNARWQAEMAGFFTGLGDRRPDEGFLLLDEVFNLESQLAAHDTEAVR